MLNSCCWSNLGLWSLVTRLPPEDSTLLRVSRGWACWVEQGFHREAMDVLDIDNHIIINRMFEY